jgi:hypothetical protein
VSNPALRRLLKKVGHHDLLENLDKLPLSEFNSLMLEVFKRRTGTQKLKEVLNAYKNNRFARPSSIDALSFMATEFELLKLADQKGFNVMELSPLAPLGSTSAVALVDQNKIVSALRGTEVVADATNVLALEAVTQRQRSSFSEGDVHYCATHRHVRAQSITVKGFTAHFKIFCAVSAGGDRGNFLFEREAIVKHLQLYYEFFAENVRQGELKIIIKSIINSEKENPLPALIFEAIKSAFREVDISLLEVPQAEHNYYDQFRFSLNLVFKGVEYNLGDGGLVNWAQKLTGNKKERMFTSGLGTELLWKLLNDRI